MTVIGRFGWAFGFAWLFSVANCVAAAEHFPVLGTASVKAGPARSVAGQGLSARASRPRRRGPERRFATATRVPLDAGVRRPSAAATTNPPPRIAGRPLADGFEGVTDSGFIPADPNVAAGPTELVVTVNGGVALMTKSGTLILQRTLDEFHDAPLSPGQSTYDPRVIYDPHSGRFFSAALEGDVSPNTWLHIAVSKSSSPANLNVGMAPGDAWWGYALDADQDGGEQVNDNAPDYDAIGVDRYNLYVTANMFSNAGIFQYVKIWVLPKAQLLAGEPVPVYEFGAPPAPPLGNPVTGYDDFAVIPGINFDQTAQHMLSTNALSQDGLSGSITLWEVNDPGTTPTLSSYNIDVDGWNDFYLPQCVQSGGGVPVDMGDTTIGAVVERSGSLWATHSQPNAPSGARRSEVRWYEIDPATATVYQYGKVADPTRCYFYPAIHADAQWNMSLVMSGVDATIFPSAFYTGRDAADPAGTVRDVETLKLGLSNYVSLDGGGLNRWGDFSNIAEDPVSGDLWMIHEYASSVPGQWSTWIGRQALSGGCVGDCDQNGKVTVNELIAGIEIASGTKRLASCPAFDCYGDGWVTVDCLIRATHAALAGCSAAQ